MSVARYNGTHGSVVLYVPEAMGDAAKEYLPIAGSQFVFRNQSSGAWIMMVRGLRVSRVRVRVRVLCRLGWCVVRWWAWIMMVRAGTRGIFFGGGLRS